ncbi:uncharacterized protein BDR25DRAFT_362363 [Lindgomyces ingoldianus]|uniref:Uncharacterized protein n=1 Tax=Lindgomyces ingoldianus TaxID=673940 RepID=A0ACB6QA39_9PLEO|nr:uncharacterized protein BDR25DRAFT_362363 [Lindgomyces ingoldianus]KAF2463819.1 hypothetical protein BDR25DRAFT_362363 [Lindgomyces ingoldianus]
MALVPNSHMRWFRATLALNRVYILSARNVSNLSLDTERALIIIPSRKARRSTAKASLQPLLLDRIVLRDLEMFRLLRYDTHCAVQAELITITGFDFKSPLLTTLFFGRCRPRLPLQWNLQHCASLAVTAGKYLQLTGISIFAQPITGRDENEVYGTLSKDTINLWYLENCTFGRSFEARNKPLGKVMLLNKGWAISLEPQLKTVKVEAA